MNAEKSQLKTEPKNARSVTLHLEAYYDCTKTTPEQLAEHFDAMFQDARIAQREYTDEEYGPTHCNKLHVPEPLSIVDGAIEDVAAQEATALSLKERGCDFNVETVVLNEHGQAWFHVYLELYDDALRLLVHDTHGVDDRPVVDVKLCEGVSVLRKLSVTDGEGQPMPTYSEEFGV